MVTGTEAHPHELPLIPNHIRDILNREVEP